MCNRRIVIVDPTETPDYMKYWGSGLGTEIYTTDSLEKMTQVDLQTALSLGDSDAAMLVGSGGYKYFFEKTGLHAGVRSENWFDCSKLDRLSVEGGSFVKVQADFPTPEEINIFMSPNFSNHVDFTWFKSKVIHDFDGALRFLEWLDCRPEDQYYGFDYEASGMALDRWFELSGASLCTQMYGGFISFTDIRHTATPGEYQTLCDVFARFIEKRQSHLVTYNMQYEQAVSHRMFGVDLYNLVDASVYNVIEGNHLKKYSLKWSAQKYLHATVWDTEFDRISDLIDSMLFETVGKLKADKHKVLRVTQDNFDQTPEWAELMARYPGYEDEFRALILEYWGNPFMCIPSEILGKYCNLDAFYTLMIHEAVSPRYSQECIRTFMDNTRLGARLHNCGLYIDEPFRLEYAKRSKEMIAWGITYCAEARCRIKMAKHAAKMADINKYSDIAQKLLKENRFFNGNPIEIAKYLLTTNVDTMDAYELGINEGELLMKYGPAFATQFLVVLREAMEDCGMIKLYKKTGEKVLKSKIDSSIGGKKKIQQVLGDKLVPIIGLDKVKINEKHIELEKYLYYERAYNELMKVSKTQLNDIMNIPQEIYAFGKKWELLEYADYVSDNFFKCKSPIENDEICLEFAQLFLSESAYLAAMFESTQQLPGAEKYYELIGIQTIEDAYSHFADNWQKQYNGIPIDQTAYPEKAYSLFFDFYNHPDCDQMKEVWSNFNGYASQEQFFKYVSDQYEEYGKPFDENDITNRFFFMRKLVINYLLFKKYSKVLSTYIDGMLKEGKWVIEDSKHIPIREADPNEPGAIHKCFCHYEVNTKSSKRWSSAFHTIVSHADFKDCIRPPYHIDANGNIVDEDFIETYFDISSAEVKAAGFASGDPDLIDKFNKGEDIYIYSAKLYLGDKFDKLDKKAKKMWRKRFKTIFLGVLYGLGKKSLAERLFCSEEEAEDIIQGLYTSFPKLREYVASQQQYPFEHDGFINTMLNDKLKIKEYELLQKATPRERNNLVARCQRLGVNLPIQGGTASIMASGFFNNIRESIQEGWKQPLQPIIVVHDSNTNYVPVSKIFEIRKFYDTYYTDFCAGFGPKIKLLFDLLAGDAYERAMPMKMIDENTIEFTGNAYSMLRMYDKIMGCSDLRVECDTKREDLVPKWVTHPIDRFIREKGTNIIKDLSSYTVRFRRIG